MTKPISTARCEREEILPGAMDDAVMASSEAHQNQMMQYLNSKELQAGFQRVVFDMLRTQSGVGVGARCN